ncbi:MAG: hypothetical protein JO366_12450 [Methylobacteriaceae bacterium]|nr:hypothetical protein [Methylobacteriaceae bacterium]MBV9218453.1 hypothetical protein [Methylobacteriaceae bacterium]MBV9245611.1 hypothetical protein [Methylobacteriaceae bacterium]MBV9635006.1 hypothetical protein [Methylobacteriaceae bacterium]MBV9702606.1 hypothetical protein [Methylobacteriaceae bacterium]
MSSWVVGSGLMCAAMLMLGLGVLSPASSALAGICELVAVASGVVFVGLLDGE